MLRKSGLYQIAKCTDRLCRRSRGLPSLGAFTSVPRLLLPTTKLASSARVISRGLHLLPPLPLPDFQHVVTPWPLATISSMDPEAGEGDAPEPDRGAELRPQEDSTEADIRQENVQATEIQQETLPVPESKKESTPDPECQKETILGPESQKETFPASDKQLESTQASGWQEGTSPKPESSKDSSSQYRGDTSGLPQLEGKDPTLDSSDIVTSGLSKNGETCSVLNDSIILNPKDSNIEAISGNVTVDNYLPEETETTEVEKQSPNQHNTEVATEQRDAGAEDGNVSQRTNPQQTQGEILLDKTSLPTSEPPNKTKPDSAVLIRSEPKPEAELQLSGNNIVDVQSKRHQTTTAKDQDELGSNQAFASSSNEPSKTDPLNLPTTHEARTPSVTWSTENSKVGRNGMGTTEENVAVVTSQQTDGDVVLVTGGNGFLGQHIVKLLHLRASHVTEIRVLDLEPFQRKLEYQPSKPVTSLVGDVANSDSVHKALEGVTSVIHCAGVVSWSTFPDYEGMDRVNVKGTLNVLNACLANNVQRLIYCSTVDVAIGTKPIRGGTEDNTPVPDKFLFPGYPETKFHGERIVLGSRQHRTHNGSQLQTVILRPNVLYGELDKYYVTNALHMAKQSQGILYQIGNGKALFQQAYVGNAAWAFICADAAMKANPELTREVFYVPDQTPVQNSFMFLIPYLEPHGFNLSNGYISYALSHSAVAAAELLAKILSPLVKLNLPVQSCTIAYINTDLYFSGEKAEKILKYKPIYTPEEAKNMSLKYYATFDLTDQNSRANNRDK